MLRSAKRFVERFDPLSKLGVTDIVTGKIPPSRVRTMFSKPVVILPSIDAPGLAANLSTGVGANFIVIAFYLWKPAGSAYVGAPGNIRLRRAGVALSFDIAYGPRLTSTNADVLISYPVVFAGVVAPSDSYDLIFTSADVTGDGPPLYYAAFYVKVPLTFPGQEL